MRILVCSKHDLQDQGGATIGVKSFVTDKIMKKKISPQECCSKFIYYSAVVESFKLLLSIPNLCVHLCMSKPSIMVYGPHVSRSIKRMNSHLCYLSVVANSCNTV